MKAVFQALSFAVVALTITMSAAKADDITPMYEGELAKNACYDTGVGSHEKRPWIEEQDFLITSAEQKALAYVKKECRQLYHGRFSQTTTEFFDGHKSGRCEVSRDERRGCNALTCFGYSSGSCTTPGAHRQADAAAPKTAPSAIAAQTQPAGPSGGTQASIQ